MLTSYTTYADIRAALGVSDDELPDDTLALDLYSTNLEFEFEDIHEDLIAEYVTVSAIAVATRTTAQSRFYSLTGLFATYAVARQLGAALPMFSPKDITDGKAATARFQSPYKDTLKAINEQYDYAKGKLANAYASLSASTRVAATPVFMGISIPSYDPVTGS